MPLQIPAALLLVTLSFAPALAAFGTDSDAPPLPPRTIGDGEIVVAQNATVADLVARVQRLEGQNRQLNGQVEELTNALRRMQQEFAKYREDAEFRLQALEGGGAPPPKKRSSNDAAPAAGEPLIADAQPDAGLGAPPVDLGTLALDSGQLGSGFEDEAATGEADPNAPLDLTALGQQPVDSGLGAPAGGGQARTGLVPPGLPGVAVVEDGEPIVAAAPTATAKDEFDLSYGFLQRKEFDTAEQSFRKFLVDHPDDALVPDATHWLGESLFQRKQYRDAAEQFLKVTTDFGSSRRAPSSMLRLGMSLAALGEKEAACATLQEVGRKYPSASDTVKKAVAREVSRTKC